MSENPATESSATERPGPEGPVPKTPDVGWLWHADLERFPGLGSTVGFTVHSADNHRVGTVLRTIDHPDVGLLVVNTGPWMFGRLLAVPAGLVTEIDQDAQVLRVTCDKERLRRAPEYRAETPDAFAGYRREATDYFAPEGADRLTP